MPFSMPSPPEAMNTGTVIWDGSYNHAMVLVLRDGRLTDSAGASLEVADASDVIQIDAVMEKASLLFVFR